MSYTLQAVIGGEADLQAHEAEGVCIVRLTQGLAMIPITEALREKLGIPFLEFGHSDEALECIGDLVNHIKNKVAYVEAEFFGGDGGQACAVWDEGKLVLGPCVEKHAINRALGLLGVKVGNALDEFDAIGLGKNRDTEDWIR